MDMRGRVNAALKQAMKDRDALRLSTLRLINAAIKDKDIEARGMGEDAGGVSDEQVLAILAKMTKQRQESARAYEEGGRLDLAEQEQNEIAVIEEFLPRDMGRVMAALKAKYPGQMDFGKVGPMVKDQLCGK